MAENLLKDDVFFMEQALAEASKAAALGEVPVGAVIVVGDEVIARGHNLKESGKDATLHGEMIAIREACRVMGGWRLPKATLYVTMEPCPMCAGAMVQARLAKLVYAAADPKCGAAGSVVELLQRPEFNHRLKVVAGVKEAEAAALLSRFFKDRRQARKEAKNMA